MQLVPEPNITSYIYISWSFAGRVAAGVIKTCLAFSLGSSSLCSGLVRPLATKRREFLTPGKPLWSVSFAGCSSDGEDTVMAENTPVLDALAAMTAVSIAESELAPREHVIARLSALVAVNAPPSSYLLNAGSAIDVGITVQDVQGILIAVAPVVGTPRVMAAAGNIAKALGLAVALADGELDDNA